ncbi:hypothetical protein ACF08N_02060 [Streptomyces sp. NPDC015127]|uniref:hypothetical protein n=1 Tax=Streptomyces sp. NPDC015127 TaxID=3364939 RepID=UPI0036FABA50
MTGEDGDGELGYDTLLYTRCSRVADHAVPGVAEHAFSVTGEHQRRGIASHRP